MREGREFQGSVEEWKKMVRYIRDNEQALRTRYGNNHLYITPEGEVIDDDSDEFKLFMRSLPTLQTQQRGFFTSIDCALGIKSDIICEIRR